jgi:hypothetical protein
VAVTENRLIIRPRFPFNLISSRRSTVLNTTSSGSCDARGDRERPVERRPTGVSRSRRHTAECHVVPSEPGRIRPGFGQTHCVKGLVVPTDDRR